MKVNFAVEDFGGMGYLGCSTLAKDLYRNLSVEKSWNSTGNNFDVTHFHTFGPWTWYLLLTSDCPSVLTAHSTPRGNIGNILSSKKFWRAAYKKIYNKFDHIIAVSETSKRELLDIGVTKEISVIYNGVDREKFSFDQDARKRIRKKHGLGEDDFLVLNVGQRTPGKGVFDFIEISQRVPEAEFIWAGGIPYSVFSPDYPKVKKQTKKDYDNLKFPGEIGNIRDYYCAADLFLTTSNFETFGLTALEAMSVGLPVVSKDLEVFEELFPESRIPCENKEEIIEWIRTLMEDENLRRKCRKRSLETSEKFDIKKIADQHVELYRKVSDNIDS